MERIIGQERAVAIITQALAGGRMHHAWIFHGPSGVGKFTTALAMARILLCHDQQRTLDGRPFACGTCESCRLFDSPDAAHPDLHVVTKELAAYSDDRNIRERKQITIPVEVIKQHLLQPAYRSAMLDHGKVMIVDEAELLAHGQNFAQNAILKTLEEPPPDTYIVLITSNDHRLLPTIRSRCQRVAFVPLSDKQVEHWVDDYLERVETKLTKAQRQWVVWFASGSPGQAKLAVDYRLDEWGAAVEPMVDQIAHGQEPIEMGPTMAGLAEAFAKAWVDKHANASKDAANKSALRYMFGLLGDICRRRIEAVTATLPAGDRDATEVAVRPWLIGIELLQQAERDMEANVAVALLLDNLAVQWAVANHPSSVA